MVPAICNGCGSESPAWDKFCVNCEKEVTCQSCNRKYKRGQGLCDVDICPKCLNEAFMEEEEREEFEREHADLDPFEEYGWDHSWEL